MKTKQILRALGIRTKEVRDEQTGVLYIYLYKRGIRTPIGGFLNRLPSERRLRAFLLESMDFQNVKLNS